MIARERHAAADMLVDLSAEQLRTQSLCTDWTVQDVAGHLIVPLEVSMVRFALAMISSRGFDRANAKLARQQGERPISEIIAVLRRKADHRFTPPGGGPEMPLTDLLVHGMDIRRPLGIARAIPEDRTRVALTSLTEGGNRVGPAGRLDGLRLQATDIDWSHGQGAPVTGASDALILAIAARPAALDELHGDGVAILRERLTTGDTGSPPPS